MAVQAGLQSPGGASLVRYCELCGQNEITALTGEIVPVLIDGNMETFLCNPGCVKALRPEMTVELLDD